MQDHIALKIENLSKQYRLGVVGTNTLRGDLQSWWHRMRGKEDPTVKIGDENKLAQAGGEYIWALRDINLEVKKGEVLGIIGKNGAGKSTLLKILSRVTGPTTGKVEINGSIASLLEVGTGFHPELTGRENIFLNGAILGMSKAEIRKKIDEIVDFAGVAKYMDTPVKRYSSGMRVRLGFAVAAFLEPDILVVDEVLAVGDAEFQKKAIGKMQDVAGGGGRTVLFVSHNMNSINSLCTKTMYLRNGEIKNIGNTEEIINEYLSLENIQKSSVKWEKNKPGDDIATLNYVRLINENLEHINFIDINKKCGIEYEYELLQDDFQPMPNIHVYTSKNEFAFVSSPNKNLLPDKRGKYKAIMWLPANFLNNNNYIFGIALSSINPTIVHFYEKEALIVESIENIDQRESEYKASLPGIIRPKLEWTLNKK